MNLPGYDLIISFLNKVGIPGTEEGCPGKIKIQFLAPFVTLFRCPTRPLVSVQFHVHV